MRALAVTGAALLFCTAALAHDHWINQGRYTSPIDGMQCCGENDCFVIPPEQIRHITQGESGYVWRRQMADAVGEVVSVSEFIPDHEVQASKDGQFWRCRKPDGSRRCFFAPFPST